jgi:hypothetical protein
VLRIIGFLRMPPVAALARPGLGPNRPFPALTTGGSSLGSVAFASGVRTGTTLSHIS